MALEGLHIHIADGTEGYSTIGLESVNQALAFDFLAKLLLDGDENFGFYRFEINIRLITDDALKVRSILVVLLNRV